QRKPGKDRDVGEQAVDGRVGQHDRQQAVLEAVVVEDVRVRRRDQRAKAVIGERPRRVLARAAAAEVAPREQDRRALVTRLVQHEVGIGLARRRIHARLAVVGVTPRVEQVDAEARTPDRLQELLRNDGVGVDVRAIERRDDALVNGEWLHVGSLYESRRTSTKCPASAAAAAMAGLTRCVRPPAPCRPSKLRFDVDAQRSPGSSRSSFIARHIEQPGSRHSKPAARNTASSPSDSACALTLPDPGTTSASLTLDATWRPRATAAAARRSSMREFVHEPMNTLSMRMSVIGVFGTSPMYSSARSIPSRRIGSRSLSGSGTRPSIVVTISGDVPQVTCGAIVAASTATTRSNFALASDESVRQYATARSHISPDGENGSPLR